jgi:hypothetical protein
MFRSIAMLAILAGSACCVTAARSAEAPWCAVISLGYGNAYWECLYRSIEECRPHVLAGNKGFCTPNPAAVPVRRTGRTRSY